MTNLVDTQGYWIYLDWQKWSHSRCISLWLYGLLRECGFLDKTLWGPSIHLICHCRVGERRSCLLSCAHGIVKALRFETRQYIDVVIMMNVEIGTNSMIL